MVDVHLLSELLTKYGYQPAGEKDGGYVHRAEDGGALNTYKDNFVALPPAVMRSMGAKYGDHVMMIVDDGTKEGRCVYGIVGEIAVQPVPHPRGDGGMEPGGMGYTWRISPIPA